MLKAACSLATLVLLLSAQEKMTPVSTTRPTASGAASPPAQTPVQPPAPGTQPADEVSGVRTPPQINADLLNQLLRADRQRLVPPSAVDAKVAASAENAGLLLEGTILVDRPGRCIIRGDRAEFEFAADASGKALPPMEVLKTQLLEYIERDVAAGTAEFIVSAEVKRYRGRNTIELIKVSRRVAHGNLGP